MAQEIQRQFHHAQRMIHVRIKDQLGSEHVLQCNLGQERCPACLREYPQNAEKHVDFEALIKQVCEELRVECERVIPIFEAHGADMSAFKK